MTEIIEETIELAADAAELMGEEALQVASATRRLAPRDIGLVSVGVVIGTVAGAAVAYKVASKRLETKYQKIADEEILEIKGHYAKKMRDAKIYSDEDKPKLDDLVGTLGYVDGQDESEGSRTYTPEEEEAIAEANAQVFAELQEEKEAAGHVAYNQMGKPKPAADGEANIFDNPVPEWDYATEMRNREEDSPYVIHKDEYEQNEKDYEQIVLTYFLGDEVLADIRDGVIDNADFLVGLENLKRFGQGSKDPNVVYIRNEQVDSDFEIVLSTGKWSHEVAGESLQHSEPRHHKRHQRFDDERR